MEPKPADFNQYLSVWSDKQLHMATMLSAAHVWDMFGDAGCYIGSGGPFSSGEGYDAGAMTDPARTPFERLLYKPATAADPHAFIAARTLPGKEFRKRCSDSMGILGDLRANLRDKADGLVIYNLHPSLVSQRHTDEDEDSVVEACCERTETDLRARYGSALVQWV